MQQKGKLLFVFLFFTAAAMAQGTYNIKDFGAVGDGVTVNTKAVQKAVDACTKNGGGTVEVPPGVYLSGTLRLYSHNSLHLQNGAVLKGSSKLSDYTPAGTVHLGLIYAEDATDITIYGEGNIDGNGDNYMDLTKAKRIDNASTVYTRQKEHFREVASGLGDGPVVPKDRPYQMFIFSNCTRVTLRDIFISNAPFWTVHFADCDAVNVKGIRLWNNLLVANSDGIDVTSCSNVNISDCDIRVGDDAIVVVGYAQHFEIPGYKHLRHLSENINISNCSLQSYSSGIRIGYLDQNSVKNINVNNINIFKSSRGIGIFLRDEGSLENITFSNITIETVLHTGDWWGNGEPIHISAIRGKDSVKLGSIRNVYFNNITCKSENGIILYGTPESIIENVKFNHLVFELTDSKLNDVAGGNVDLRGVSGIKNQLFARDIPAFLAENVKGLTINDFRLTWTKTRMPFFTHGIEVNHFTDVNISGFNGTASPINNKAYKVYLTDGKGLVIDTKKGLLSTNVQ